MAAVLKKKIREPRQKRLPQALSDADVRRLLGCVRNPVHRGCFALMYACGLRIMEAASLHVGAVDKNSLVLRIIGKGNTERCVPLPEPVLLDLRRLWSTHRHGHWLFPNRAGTNHVERGVLGRTFREAAEQPALSPRPTPHSLRHSYATRLMENGVSIRVVQILLGHARLKTTALYTHLTEPTRDNLRRLLDGLMSDL